MRLKVLVLAAMLAFCFVGAYVFMPQANAAEGATVTPWAEVKTFQKYTKKDKDANGGVRSDTDLEMEVLPQVNFGVRGSWNGVGVTASAMLNPGTFADDATKTSDVQVVKLFLAYITYKFADVDFTIGRAPTFYSGLDFNNVGGWDLFLGYSTFNAFPYMIRFAYMGAYVGLEKPGLPGAAGFAPYSGGTVSSFDVLYPRINAGYVYGNPGTPVSFDVSGHFQQVKNDDGTGTGLDGKKINSYAVEGTVNLNLPVGFGLNAHVNYMVNGGLIFFATGGSPEANVAGDDYEDTKSVAGHVGAYYKVNQIKVAAGLAYKQLENDNWSEKDKNRGLYASLFYNIQPNFVVAPTVQLNDAMKDKDGNKQGKTWTFGLYVSANI